MAYKVRFRFTRNDSGTAWNNMNLSNSGDVGLIGGYVSANNGTVQNNNVSDTVKDMIYTFPTQEDWQNFYNSAITVWNNNGVSNSASDAGITIDVDVIENT